MLTIYNCFVRTHLDYGDIIYDQAFGSSFHQKIESLQYIVDLAITGVIRKTSKLKIYHELGSESLKPTHWYRKLCFILKIYDKPMPEIPF